ncbi:MAG: 16S rRNA (adenine(1518)-N(6)/adenine(1519)-N(6))-dimethyltransferase RsmA [Planctomycetota bacterium]
MNLEPVSLSRLRAALEVAAAPPRRRHGQNFLLDNNLLAAIVRDAGVGPDDHVLEIGPGPGLLTRHLLATGATVTAFEVDARVEVAARSLIEPDLQVRLRWVQGDVLPGGRRLAPELSASLSEQALLVANLPYNISAPLLGALFEHPDCPRRMVVMLQREVAVRLVAKSGESGFGPLSVLCQLSSPGRVLRQVPAQSFWPAPTIRSVVTHFERVTPRLEPLCYQALAAFLPLAFHNRRKTLVNSVSAASGLSPSAVVARLAVGAGEEKMRAEDLPSVQLLHLALEWAQNALSGRNRS